jgi:hypothetical protein
VLTTKGERRRVNVVCEDVEPPSPPETPPDGGNGSARAYPYYTGSKDYPAKWSFADKRGLLINRNGSVHPRAFSGIPERGPVFDMVQMLYSDGREFSKPIADALGNKDFDLHESYPEDADGSREFVMLQVLKQYFAQKHIQAKIRDIAEKK